MTDGRHVVGVSMRDRRLLRIRRAAMIWQLHQSDITYTTIARALKLSVPRVAELGALYDRVLADRTRRATDWVEPWAKRLRAAGAIG